MLLESILLVAAAAVTGACVEECLTSYNVPFSVESSPDYNNLTKPYNLRLWYKPAVVVIPDNDKVEEQLHAAMRCASMCGTKVQAKSGGHSYASFSSGGRNGSMVVDLQNLQDINVGGEGTVTAGAGVRIGTLAAAVYARGKRGLAHGTCPGIGVGGHFTHGGFGYQSRAWGLALDHIYALDVVLSNGSMVHATPDKYPEVYYAMRGAADSFGIVTKFWLNTIQAPPSVIDFAFEFAGLYGSAENLADGFLHVQDFVRNSTVVDSNLGFGMYLDGQVLLLRGSYFGDLDHFNSVIAAELLRGLPTPSTSMVNKHTYLESLELLAGGSLSVPAHGYDLHDNFFAKSITVPEHAPLTRENLVSYFSYIIAKGVNPPAPWFSILNLYGGPGSKINAKDLDFAAYSDRKSLWVFQHYVFKEENQTALPQEGMDFITGLSQAVTQNRTDFGAYLNYVDPSLSAEEAYQLYYGQELYDRLVEIKRLVDPYNLFWNPQTIVGFP
ncbi:Glucooligosaccharide oxidase [Aulographum hederae CBS 113979]|uniref:Glucooligosaccharide oxidase n=1 Tax=Aulographum hederae CBS 113979 TaxID=1176131 RepID=A0A6G1HGX1_9PEZI|nr:Glucooligosaccharide oxidase [Aulographum hederae CBS 113979]